MARSAQAPLTPGHCCSHIHQGTAAVKWTRTQGIDGATNTSTTQGWYMAITHMTQYQNYSFEELRVHDYEARRVYDYEVRVHDYESEAKEAWVQEAPRRAQGSFDFLRSLGESYQFVCGQRQHQQGLGVSVKAFEHLVDILAGGGGGSQGGDDAHKHPEILEMAANKVEHKGAELRKGLATIQREIQLLVASVAENLDTLHIQSLLDLPDEVKQKIQHRDWMRDQYARKLQSTMQDLLQEGIQPDRYIMEGSRGITTRSDLENVVELLSAKDAALESALTHACEVLHVHKASAHTKVDPAPCDMGFNFNAGARSDEESSQYALASYSWVETYLKNGHALPWVETYLKNGHAEWVETYLKNRHALASDAAMLALKSSFANEAAVASVLGFGFSHANVGSQWRENNILKTALISAGSAIAQESQHQFTDALTVFPCTALLQAGRQRLLQQRAECAALKRIVKVYRMLEEDLQVNDDCKVGVGERCKKKDEAVNKLHDARVVNKKAKQALQMLTAAMDNVDQKQIEDMLRVMNLSSDTKLEDSQQHLRATLNELTNCTLQLTGEIQRHFPEVILFIGLGLPPELGSLWRPSQSLDSFHKKELVESESRHKVWKVWLDQECFAIKEYSTARASDLRTCLREATIIHKLQHHAIVEIKALFQGTGSDTFYMKMPWYTHGSLDTWVRGYQRPDWRQVRSVLLDALIGLEHLHHNGVIHGDVKPANILVDGRERGRLSDFDISIDTKVRTSAARIINKATTTVRATALGMTSDFAAPELRVSGQATKHTDMFAYGKSVLNVQDHCEPGGEVLASGHLLARGQTAPFIQALTSIDPKVRLLAKDGMCWPFFRILKDVCVKATRVCELCEMNGEEGAKDPDAGIECLQGHFHCCQCVSTLTKDLLKIENRGKCAALEGQVMCCKYPTQCNAASFDHRDLARMLSTEDFHALNSAKIEIMQAQMKLEFEAEMQVQLAEELLRMEALGARARKVLMARKHVEEEILQMKCPRCKTAFYDFEGCFAISCSSCPCKFCGWCLHDCAGGDAHPHVRGCGKVPPGVDALFPQMPTVRGAFETMHKQRCQERINVYLQTLDLDIRQDVSKAVHLLL